ncbi:acetolactate synthase small subunit [Catenovulum sp. 2E275]|uniref:acetolactate synthase small subunit n=1 Tax=Catenovulum sp. 2E275 TaxID=2980497 RepID=UPI0021D3DA9D|nr:acetolactate synthase small subunit [Catenovulum sp. 2E275]MCU4677560.1 acetolactate synthase small subunit [Catenovulum sp. 2E275]
MKTILAVTVENKPCALSRVVGLFSQRGYNIESLSVNRSPGKEYSKIILITHGTERVIEQVIKQLEKLINVSEVKNLTSTIHEERQMSLIKVCADSLESFRLLCSQIGRVFHVLTANQEQNTVLVQVTATEDEMQNIVNLLGPASILDIVSSGVIAMDTP